MKKIEKILKYIANERISVSEFERKSGLSNSYLYKTRDRDADLTKKIEERIRKNNPDDYYKIFPEEKNNETDNETTQANEKDPPSYLTRRFNEKNSVTQEPFMVPFVPIKAQAGYVRAHDQTTYVATLEKYALPPGVNPRGAVWLYWQVEGDSMEETFFEEDIVLTSQVPEMDWEENLRNFYIYIIVTDEFVCIKRLAYYPDDKTKIVMISDNEAYEQRLISIAEIKEIWLYRRTIATRAKPPKRFDIKV